MQAIPAGTPRRLRRARPALGDSEAGREVRVRPHRPNGLAQDHESARGPEEVHVPAPIPEGKAPAGKDVVVERVDVGEAREDLIPLVISATEDYQDRIQQALSEHQAQVDEAKVEKKPPPKKLTRSDVEKRPEIVARKARLKKLSD